MSKKSKVTLSNADINAANVALNKLAGSITDIVLGFRIVQNAKPLAEIADSYNNAHRQTLIDGGAKVVGDRFDVVDGRLQFDSPENEAAALLKLNELSAIETEVEYYPLSLSRLESSGVALDYNLIIPLQWMIVDDVE